MSQLKPKKVFVGLSGGVDSSVSAALLKKAGFSVTGVFIRVWQPDFFECSWKEDRLDAMRICAKLSIPFVELDLENEYKKEVVDYMIREYKAGKTPNPDVMCNRFIKFGGFYNWAMKEGADFVATGHYARVLSSTRSSLSSSRKRGSRLDSRIHGNDKFVLCSGLDALKDQSYFLWQIRKEQLPHILFPVGGMKKPEVRKLAKKFGLVTADKKDSQGLCFIGKVDMKEFLSHYIKPKRGNVVDEKGSVIGEHDGVFFYTIGERLGINCRHLMSTDLQQSSYVVSKNIRTNTLTVSHKSPSGNLNGTVTAVEIKDCNWLSTPIQGKTYGARTRYRQPLQKARIVKSEYRIKQKAEKALPKSSIIPARTPKAGRHNSRFLIRFESPQSSLASGQSLVLYDGDVCIGGGIIK